MSRLEARYKDKTNVEWDYERDNIYAMKKSDIMISDFSGIIYDYTFLCDKPVMYVNADLDLRPYDAYDIDGGKNLWQFKTLQEIGVELKEADFGNIKKVIETASDSQELAQKRKAAKACAWQFQGEAGAQIVDYMVGLKLGK